MTAALRWGTRGPPDALTPSPEQTWPCQSPCSKALSLCSVQCPRENRPWVGLGVLGLVRFGFQSLLDDVLGKGDSDSLGSRLAQARPCSPCPDLRSV